jgi:hypothetical protein
VPAAAPTSAALAEREEATATPQAASTAAPGRPPASSPRCWPCCCRQPRLSSHAALTLYRELLQLLLEGRGGLFMVALRVLPSGVCCRAVVAIASVAYIDSFCTSSVILYVYIYINTCIHFL